MEKVKKFINKSFNRRIQVFFIPVIVLLIVIVSMVSYYIFSSAMEGQMTDNIGSIVEQANYTVDLYFKDAKTTMAYLGQQESIVHMLLNYDHMDTEDRYYEQQEIDSILSNTSFMKDHISDCMIVGVNGYQSNMPQKYNIKMDTDLLDEEWMQPYIGKPQKFYFTPSHKNDYYYSQDSEDSINVISVILPVDYNQKRIGYLILDMDFNKMNELISLKNSMNGLQFLITDTEGMIIFADRSEDLKMNVPDGIVDAYREKKNGIYVNYDKEKYFAVYQSSEVTDWELLGIIPARILNGPARQLLLILVFIILPVFILLTFILSRVMTRRIKEPLSDLVVQMEGVDIENPNPFVVKNSVSEIEELGSKITEMIDRINHLVKQSYLLEMNKKDAQIEALLSQINPHFLYNTLQLIKTDAVINDSKNVSYIINCLSKFLRYTINNKQMYVELADEIDHIHYFSEIYKLRFPGKFKMEVKISDEMKRYCVPKLILQPLIENSIRHGIKEKEDGGYIIVSSEAYEEDLYIFIEDNGLGIPENRIELMKERLHHPGKEDGHVGLSNVHERIVLRDGEGYGIKAIESQENKYTKVTLRLKARKELPHV